MDNSEKEQDPFDRLYSRWASYALDKGLAPPSRERWDATVLFLLSSQDPERVARYRDVVLGRGDSLGTDAYELWEKTPDYVPNRSARVKTQRELQIYEAAHLGSMRTLMEARGLGERYKAIVAGQVEYDRVRREKAKKAQNSVLIMGCAGMGSILLMMLSVLLIIALQMTGK
ncbi:MAG: hypothetical protein WCD37_20440 [Chloroflexia bacterium]